MTATIDELLETFDLLGDDWEERFRYIISLGKELPPMPDEAKTEENRVQGCQSQAWLIARDVPGPQRRSNSSPTPTPSSSAA